MIADAAMKRQSDKSEYKRTHHILAKAPAEHYLAWR